MEKMNDMEVKSTAINIEYKTLFDTHLGQLDDAVMEHLNSGWMPHGPQYYSVKDEWYVQPLLRLPKSMMPPR